MIADGLLAFRAGCIERVQVILTPVTVAGVEEFGRVLNVAGREEGREEESGS